MFGELVISQLASPSIGIIILLLVVVNHNRVKDLRCELRDLKKQFNVHLSNHVRK